MKLKIAVQKSGRLYEESVKLLRECGIDLNNSTNALRAEATNFPLEVLYLRDDDIPGYIADGVADAGIVGENVLLEKRTDIPVAERLQFARCRLSIAIPRTENYTGIEWLSGKKIATSYPSLLRRYLQKKSIATEIHEISGSVEIAPGIGLADAVCDIVSSGSTLLLNGLKETEVILRSEAVLAIDPALTVAKHHILTQLLFRIRAVKKARKNKYILLNAPEDRIEEIAQLIPGMKSPTILPLAIPGWCSLHSVVPEDDFWQVTEALKNAGAEGILVIPIEKMIV